MSATAAAHAAPLPSRKTWARNAQSTIGVEEISVRPHNASVWGADSMIYMTKPSMAVVGRQAKEGQRNHRPRMAKDIIDLGRTKSKPTQGSSVGTGAVRKVVLCHAKAQNRRQCHSHLRLVAQFIKGQHIAGHRLTVDETER